MPSLIHGEWELSKFYEALRVLTELMSTYGPRSILVDCDEPRPEPEDPHTVCQRTSLSRRRDNHVSHALGICTVGGLGGLLGAEASGTGTVTMTMTRIGRGTAIPVLCPVVSVGDINGMHGRGGYIPNRRKTCFCAATEI